MSHALKKTLFAACAAAVASGALAETATFDMTNNTVSAFVSSFGSFGRSSCVSCSPPSFGFFGTPGVVALRE